MRLSAVNIISKWIKGSFIHQIRYLVLMFCRMTIFVSLAGLHCVAISAPPLTPNTVHRGPPREAVSPALRSTKPGDTAVKQNLWASLSPGCQGRTSGMSPGDKGRLVAWFLHMLTFVSFHVLYGNSWHWGWLGYHKGSPKGRLSDTTTKDVVETRKKFRLNLHKLENVARWASALVFTDTQLFEVFNFFAVPFKRWQWVNIQSFFCIS